MTEYEAYMWLERWQREWLDKRGRLYKDEHLTDEAYSKAARNRDYYINWSGI